MDSKSRSPFGQSRSSSPPSSLSSSTSPLVASRLYSTRGSVLNNDCYSRSTSVKLDSDYQGSRLHRSSRDCTFPETCHSSWKLSSSSSALSSGSRNHSWSETSPGSRSKLVDTERYPGSYHGLLSPSQDCDSKRPKLSYASTSSYLRSPSTSGVSPCAGINDSSWRYNTVPKIESQNADLGRSRREFGKKLDQSFSGTGDYTRRNGVLLSSTSTASGFQDRTVASYAQGARPKESSLTSVRANASTGNSSLSSDIQSSLYSREMTRSSTRAVNSASGRNTELSQRTPVSDSRYGRTCSWYTPGGERSASSSSSSSSSSSTSPSSPLPMGHQRQFRESADPDGRRTTRQLLSRLASSMSSTFFSRRSSQDSSASRSTSSVSEDASVSRVHVTSPSTERRNSSPDISERRTSDTSPGLSFFRRNRQGLSPVHETLNSVSDPEILTSASSENRNSNSWISSSLRNRYTPLFSRRRREGRDETAQMTGESSDSYESPLYRVGRRESSEYKVPDGEEDPESNGEASSTAPASSTTASSEDVPRVGRSLRIPDSFFRLAMPSNLDSTLPENVMITVDILAGNRPEGQSQNESSMASRDPEKLKKIQESLLLEDSDEEEGDLCRICQMGVASPSNPLIEPCRCTGSLQYVHQECMKKWLQAKINSGSSLEAITTCELCKEKLHLNIENFDIDELYRTRANERAEYEFISCGLYLVVLLHLCEQRFSDMLGAANEASAHAGFINLARTLHEHMDDLESSYEESEEEADSRPSFDFDEEEEEGEY
ncbi:E3 ubiquitin-protein ligase MARCH7 isoform X2 [Polypterus senegalus]|nr:E3 ubiquitin-protein ligase MARCH7 isoform X2 [Polypterus senegalus]